MSETPSRSITLADQIVERYRAEGLAEALRWIAHAATGDAGRRAANKRPELAEIPGGALKLMATLMTRLAGEIDAQGAAIELGRAIAADAAIGAHLDDAMEREIAGAPAAESAAGGMPAVTIERTDLTTGQTVRLPGVPAGTKLTTVFADESGAKVAPLGAAVVEAAEVFHDGSPLEFVFDIVQPEPWEPGREQVGATTPLPAGYFVDVEVANEHAPGSAPKA